MMRSWNLLSASLLVVCSASVGFAQADCYRDTVLADGPIGYWRLGEAATVAGEGGTAVDQTGTRAGTYRGGVTLAVSGAPRLDSTQTAGRFAGTTFVEISNPPVASSLAAHTVELWFKADTLSAGDNFLYSEGVGAGSIFCVRVAAGGVMQYGVFTSATAWRFATGTRVIQTGQWYYVAAVLGPTGQSLYLSDPATLSVTLEASNPATGPSDFVATSAEIGSGRFSGGATFDHFSGTIDEVAVHPTALTLARLQERVRDRQPGVASQPVKTLVCPQGPASFSVTGSGDGPFTYQWRLNGDPIAGATANPYVFTGTVYNRGLYDCVVSNACGAVTTSTAELVICVGDFDCSGGTPDAGDIEAFFAAWLAGDEKADTDGSGFTPDVTDIAAFFDAFLAGC